MSTLSELKIKDVGNHLKDHGIKPSYQRIKIFEYLMKKRNHPTVDTIYKALAPRIPTLSKTTVYNTLKTFVNNKVARIVIIEENESRYDADVTVHGHFKCIKCGIVYDLDIDSSKIDIPELTLHEVHEHHFDFKGICHNCLKA